MMRRAYVGGFAALAFLAAWSVTPARGGAKVRLDECVRAAMAENPDAEAAEARIAAARAMGRQARSGWWPMLSLGASHARTDNPPQAFMMDLNQRALNMMSPTFNPNEPDDTGNTRLTFGVKYRLFDFGARSAGVAGADAMLAARKAMAQAVRNQLEYEVTAAYYGVLQAREMAAVQAEQARSIEESLRAARARLERGATVKADVLSLEVRLAQAQEDLIRASNGVALAVAALNTAIGREIVENAEALEAPADDPALPVCEDEERCVLEHPAYRAAKAAAAARNAAWRGARAARRPTVNLFGSSDWDSPDLSDFEQSYLVGVAAEWDLFDGGRRRGAEAEARAEARAAEAETRRTLNQLRLDLRQAVLRAKEAFERREVAARAEASAAEALRLTKARYEQGAAELAEILNAEVGHAAIRARKVAAAYDFRIALSNVERARGRLGFKPYVSKMSHLLRIEEDERLERVVESSNAD